MTCALVRVKTVILIGFLCLTVHTTTARGQTLDQAADDIEWLRSSLNDLAVLPGQPATVSAGGLTQTLTPLLTIENHTPYSASTRQRIVIVAGLDAQW